MIPGSHFMFWSCKFPFYFSFKMAEVVIGEQQEFGIEGRGRWREGAVSVERTGSNGQHGRIWYRYLP